MLLDRDRSKFLVASATAVVALFATGCGRTQSALTPRLDVTQAMDEASAEQQVNNQIDIERRETEAKETPKTILASSEEADRSWKDRLLSKKAAPKPADFGEDPFLDGLDDMIAEEADHLARVARDSVQAAGGETADLISAFEPAEAPQQILQKIDGAASEAVADAAEIFGGTADDIFGEPSPRAPSRTTHAEPTKTPVRRVARSVVHSFDDLFEEAVVPASSADELQRLATDNELPQDARQVEPSSFAPELEAPETAIAGLFEPAKQEVSAVAGENLADTLPEAPKVPEFPDVAELAQKDAVVTPNRPATLPSPSPATPIRPAPEGLSDSDFAEMTRVEADPYDDPSFNELAPELPPVADFSPVEIPREPAPRFAQATHQPSAVTPKDSVVVQTNSRNVAPSQQPSVAAVLPDVNWQGRTAAPRTLRAPSEWTAWFLMGGAGLIILLLFAPGRRE